MTCELLSQPAASWYAMYRDQCLSVWASHPTQVQTRQRTSEYSHRCLGQQQSNLHTWIALLFVSAQQRNRSSNTHACWLLDCKRTSLSNRARWLASQCRCSFPSREMHTVCSWSAASTRALVYRRVSATSSWDEIKDRGLPRSQQGTNPSTSSSHGCPNTWRSLASCLLIHSSISLSCWILQDAA